MAKVKEWAILISHYVYESNMTDRGIIEATRPGRVENSKGSSDRWLKEQIEAVRRNPEIYRGMVE